jgi:hypothetical protein
MTMTAGEKDALGAAIGAVAGALLFGSHAKGKGKSKKKVGGHRIVGAIAGGATGYGITYLATRTPAAASTNTNSLSSSNSNSSSSGALSAPAGGTSQPLGDSNVTTSDSVSGSTGDGTGTTSDPAI